jgi:hypothetical protein
VLEQGPTPVVDAGFPAATEEELAHWAYDYQTDYSLVNDPTQSLDMAAAVKAWPALIIIDLSTMQVVSSAYGEADSFLDIYSDLLSGTPDGG